LNNPKYEKLSKPIAFSNERVCLEELSQKEHKHFHPSGIPEPSKEDIAITRRLEEAGKLLGIYLLDHIIIGEDSFVSLQEKVKNGYTNISLCREDKVI
jgi:DNA repair proteins